MSLIKEHEYIVNTDLSQYEGEWIAVSDEKVLAHGMNITFDASARRISMKRH